MLAVFIVFPNLKYHHNTLVFHFVTVFVSVRVSMHSQTLDGLARARAGTARGRLALTSGRRSVGDAEVAFLTAVSCAN